MNIFPIKNSFSEYLKKRKYVLIGMLFLDTICRKLWDKFEFSNNALNILIFYVIPFLVYIGIIKLVDNFYKKKKNDSVFMESNNVTSE